ncbi:ATP-binding protein [Bacillus sp. FJAT-49736]|uniref:ATP-binding protein n=1 Tax=Bacillus sp. FJAT-49736 TaxID=2833582 RepID=UPI001BC9F8F9|nr:ATP-binding protein [Bacillus sp. FJAT-49736]MBS4171761.1 STAS domain-containing protein [Bacillus sp. FJAT-49736]
MEESHLGHEELNDEVHLSQLASVGQIAAGIAHEVRNPLTAVKGFLQLMQSDSKEEYIEIAQSELENALITLNNLLQVSKPDLEDEAFQPIHLAVELETILNLFQDKLYKIEIITDFKNTEVPISGRKNQLKKVFFNLIKNAIESIADTGTIKITHYTLHNEVHVIISDTGIGIPKDKLSILGTPFYSTKENGTGMGLTQVFSVVYQHGGKIVVDSEENIGTTFKVILPQQNPITKRSVSRLELQCTKNFSISEFFVSNRQNFEKHLLSEAINVKDKIAEIQTIGNINLIENAHRLTLYIVENREHELIQFAKNEGIAWAKHSLTLAFKLEWVQAIRRTTWEFLYNYISKTTEEPALEDFFSLEKNINALVDQFLNHFFISYSKYKDELISSQMKIVENLSVPIIPITEAVCILPLIGAIDATRMRTIGEKVIDHIGSSHIQFLIIDLSGVAQMDAPIINKLIQIIDGISMMGCQTVLTGIRSEIVKNMLNHDLSFKDKAMTKGTLQLALTELLCDPKAMLPLIPNTNN